MHDLTRQLLALVLTLGLATPGCAARQPAATTAPQGTQTTAQGATLPRPHSSPFSREDEIRLGREAAAEAMKQLPVLPTSHPVSRYIERLGQDIARQTPAPQWPYTFRVVNQKEINAFALPGGPVFVNVGTIQAADNESELAGVIGHEIAHVYMRHGASQANKQGTIGGLAQLGGAILGSMIGGVGGQLAQLGLAVGAHGLATKYSREAEREADKVGAYVLHQANIDPRGMVSFFEELSSQSGGRRGPQWMSSHPDPGNRARDVGDTIRQLPRRTYTSRGNDFASIKSQTNSLQPLTAEQIAQRQKQGGFGGTNDPGAAAGSPGDITPSGQFQTLDHSFFQIAYPSNWEAFGDQESQVTIAPRAGISQNAIAYGVVINTYHSESGDRISLDQATNELMQQIGQANPGMQRVGSAQRITVNGRRANAIMLGSTSPLQTQQGGSVRERDWLVTTQMSDGSILYLVFVAPEPDFDRLRPTFDNMLRSLRIR